MKSIALIVVLILAALPALAHHSFTAEYDASRTLTLKGKFVRIDWVNPHCWIYLDVLNPATGKNETWQAEAGPPNTFYRGGWRKDSVQPGEEIVLIGAAARFRPLAVKAISVTTAAGKFLLNRSDPPTPPQTSDRPPD